MPGAVEAAGLAQAHPDTSHPGEAARCFGDGLRSYSHKRGTCGSTTSASTLASPTQDRMATNKFGVVFIGGSRDVGGSAFTADRSVHLAAFRQMLTEVDCPISARLAKVEGSIT